MRTFASLVFASILLLLAGACAQQPAAQPQSAAPPFTTTGTIKDIMDSMVEANADIVFDSVETIIDAKGEHNKLPRTVVWQWWLGPWDPVGRLVWLPVRLPEAARALVRGVPGDA